MVDEGSLPDGAYPTDQNELKSRLPKFDSRMPEHLSQEDDLLMYANKNDADSLAKLKRWGVARVLQTIVFHCSRASNKSRARAEVHYVQVRTPLIRHLYDAFRSALYPNLTGGEWEKHTLLFLREIWKDVEGWEYIRKEKLDIQKAQQCFSVSSQREFDKAAKDMNVKPIFSS